MNKNKLVSIIILLLLIGVLVLSFVVEKDVKEEEVMEDLLGINYDVEGNSSELSYDKNVPVVSMYIENYGSIVMELYPDVAKNTVNNFISLVESGFYDNNTFHRLVEDFVLQGGDPSGTGTGGPGYSIKGEFTNNGFNNDLSHTKYVVSMARSSDMDSAGSQFFIMLEDNDFLDKEYASFGKVIDGFDNLDRIVSNERIADLNSGQLVNNLVLKKAIVDYNGYEPAEVVKVK